MIVPLSSVTTAVIKVAKRLGVRSTAQDNFVSDVLEALTFYQVFWASIEFERRYAL